MQLERHYIWSKLINHLSYGIISRFVPKLRRDNISYLCDNVSPVFAMSSSYRLSNKCNIEKKMCKNHVLQCRTNSYKVTNNFNVQSLWEGEEKNNVTPKFEINDTLKFASARGDIQIDLLYNRLNEIIREGKITNINWEDIKHSVLEVRGSINEENIDAVMINQCAELSFSLCKSYFTYLKATQKRINRATYGNYLKSFYSCPDCTDDDLYKIFDIYQELVNLYPLLDSNTAQKAVFALCLTDSWKEYNKLFKTIKQLYPPSAHTYSAVIQAAFKNGEFDLGWNLIEEMKLNGVPILDEIFIFWFKINKTDKDIFQVMECLNDCNIKPSVQLVETIKRVFEDINAQRNGTYTTIMQSGICENCNAKLEPAWVSQEEYDQLKTAFLNPVLIGKDIFQKTQPEELKSFLELLEKTAPYDVVLDGLNIAFQIHKSKRSSKNIANQLKSVVNHFAIQGKKMLVFGRKHMENWPKEDLAFIRDKAHVFLAEDISQDDPFLLYATLYSGLGTRFVSRDLMRGHKFLLAERKLQDTFQKWQAQHQYFIMYIENNGKVRLKNPVPFMQNIQQNSLGDWHIPYQVKEDLPVKMRIDNYHRHWLCLTNKPIQRQYDVKRGPAYPNRKTWTKPVKKEMPRLKPPS